MTTYKVNYERDEAGWWMASVVGVDGCRTQGRTIKQARSRIREALKLFVPDADRAQLHDVHVQQARGGEADPQPGNGPGRPLI